MKLSNGLVPFAQMSAIVQQNIWWKSEFYTMKEGPKRWIEWSLSYYFLRQTAWLRNLCFQHFLVKAQTKDLLVIGDHKCKVIILIKNTFCQGHEAQWCITKWIILIVQSAFSPQIHSGGILNNLRGGWLESVNSVGGIFIKESLILTRMNSLGTIEGYPQGNFME